MLSYKAGGVHFLPADHVCNVVIVVGESFHTSHKVVSASWAGFQWQRHPSKTDLKTRQQKLQHDQVCIHLFTLMVEAIFSFYHSQQRGEVFP